jgi:ABC-2 type transport system permease protein
MKGISILRRYLGIFIRLFKFRLSNQMIYRASFWTVFIVDVSMFLIQLAVFSTLFLNVDTINGWNKYQMIFFVGTFNIIDSINMSLFFFGITSIPYKIREGKLDIYLTRPVNTLFWLSLENIDVSSTIVIIPGVIMVSYATAKLGITLTFGKVAGYLLLLILMLLLFYSLMLIIRTLSFWFIKTDALNDLEGEMIGFSFRVPGIVFTGVSKLVLYVLLPYALLATLPTQYFTTSFSLGHWALALGVTSAFVLISQWLWRLGLKNYTSASS